MTFLSRKYDLEIKRIIIYVNDMLIYVNNRDKLFFLIHVYITHRRHFAVLVHFFCTNLFFLYDRHYYPLFYFHRKKSENYHYER